MDQVIGGVSTILDYNGNWYAAGNVDIGGRFTSQKSNEDAFLAQNGGITVNTTGRIRGIGVAFEGANIVGNGNYMGLRWSSPNIYGTVDNVVSAILGTVSDIRFKTDIVEAHDEIVHKILNDISVVEYTPIDLLNNNQIGENRLIGIIAQDLLNSIPELVNYNKDNLNDYMSTNYLGFVPYLVKVVQYLNKKVLELESNR